MIAELVTVLVIELNAPDAATVQQCGKEAKVTDSVAWGRWVDWLLSDLSRYAEHPQTRATLESVRKPFQWAASGITVEPQTWKMAAVTAETIYRWAPKGTTDAKLAYIGDAAASVGYSSKPYLPILVQRAVEVAGAPFRLTMARQVCVAVRVSGQ